MFSGTLLHAQDPTEPITVEDETYGFVENDSISVNPYLGKIPAAYGTIRKERSAAAIDVLRAEEIGNTSFTNTHHTLLGRLAGLTTTHNGGEPGTNDLSFFVRGKSTFGANAPLVLVDGFESDFAHLNSYEIGSITVLKDAVATAMYGIRAANGVILVTTKRGKIGKTTLTVNADVGMLMPVSMPEFVNAYDYSRIINEAYQNDGLQPIYSDTELEGFRAANDKYTYPDVDWQDEMIKKSSLYTNASLEFRGGSKRVKYYALLGYMYADGFLKHTDANEKYSTATNFGRVNFRTNADIILNRTTDLQLGIGGRIEDRNDPEMWTGIMFDNIFSAPANRYVMYNEDGSYGGSNQYQRNPVAEMAARGYNEQHARTVNFNLRLNHKMDYLLDGLSASLEGSFMNSFWAEQSFSADYAVYERTGVDTEGSPVYTMYGREEEISAGNRSSNQNRTETFRAYLNYDKTFGDHSVTAVVLYDQQELVDRNDHEAYRFQGVSGRVNYGFQKKYYLDLVAAYNGTNSYNPDKQFGFFPAAGLAWVASNEDFMSGLDWMNHLKVRTSYGITGNYRLNGYRRFMHLSNYSSGSSYRFGKTANENYSELSVTDIANPDAEWEKGYQFNTGFDLLVFDKVNVSFDYFLEKRTDILQSVGNNVTSMGGIDLPRVNFGEVENSGFEVTVGYHHKGQDGLSWFANVNVGFAKNEITKRYEIAGEPESQIGHSIDAIFGLTTDGFYADNTDVANSPRNTFERVQAGDVKYVNKDGNDVIDDFDYSDIGNSFPEMHFGLNLGVEYKGIYFSALLDGNALVDASYKYNLVYRPLRGGDDNISQYAADNYWTPERGNSAKLPRMTVSGNNNNYRTSDLYLEDGDFIRLRTAEVGYKFPKNLIGWAKVSNAKLYVRGHNLLVIDNIDADIDPEVSSGHPLLKSFNVGLNVQF